MNPRTDDIPEKIRLLQAARDAKRHDLAMSLAESIGDSLRFARQDEFAAEIHANPDAVRQTGDLPRIWADWARGWSHFHAIALFETIGVARRREPVHVGLEIGAGQMSDPWREIRLVRVTQQGALEEIPSQILAHVRAKTGHRCEIAFQADVDNHAAANFLIFFGNPNAELPGYQTDLKTVGEGYGLDVENRFFKAQLSRQMGQLERLTSKREHGLELFAGGKGHGEPPTIDWSNDYADEGHFQKFRIRSWAECPNWQVRRGPVCVQVRRWGFPHSPVHPLFAPSRIHIDQSYAFYAGLPYFFKHGEMEAVKGVDISAMRDDEWVFSGYAFDQQLWIDRQGIVHEGKPPAERSNDLWGVGFWHGKSSDAFVALWLKHEAENFSDIEHNGSPTLHYDGHGQLWARYPARAATLNAGTVFLQRNAYFFGEFTQEKGSEMISSLRHQLINPLEIQAGDPADFPLKTNAEGRLAHPGEGPEAAPLKQEIWAALREVKDEQLYRVDANVVDLGYIYNVRVEDGVAHVLLTMPHRGRPVYDFLVTGGGGRVEGGIRERLLRISGIRDAIVRFTWEPAWNVNRISPTCREALGI